VRGELQKEPHQREGLGLAREELAAGLGGKDHTGPDRPFRRFVVEALEDGKAELADLRKQPAVVAEIRSQEFGEGEEELPMGQCEQEPLVNVRRAQEGPFLGTGRAEIKRLTAERAEVLVLAVRIGALDAGNALGVVATENELLHHLGDALDAETPVDHGVLGFVLIGEAIPAAGKVPSG
jgi:hypothetical protein